MAVAEGDMEQIMNELRELRVANAEYARLEEQRRRETEQRPTASNIEQSGTVKAMARRDLSLQSLIKSWSGDSLAIPVNEFLQEIELISESGLWTDADKKLICRLKVTGAAAGCINSRPELLHNNATFEDYRRVLTERFQEGWTTAHHWMALSTIKQERNESVRSFADRCRRLAERTITGRGSEEEIAWERKRLDSTVVAAFVKGLKGEPGRQLSYNPPESLMEAERRAAIIEQAELAKGPRADETFDVYATKRGKEDGKDFRCYQCGEKGHFARDCTGYSREPKQRNRERETNKGANKDKVCYNCRQQGHISRECHRPRIRDCDIGINNTTKPHPNESPILGGPPEETWD